MSLSQVFIAWITKLHTPLRTRKCQTEFNQIPKLLIYIQIFFDPLDFKVPARVTIKNIYIVSKYFCVVKKSVMKTGGSEIHAKKSRDTTDKHVPVHFFWFTLDVLAYMNDFYLLFTHHINYLGKENTFVWIFSVSRQNINNTNDDIGRIEVCISSPCDHLNKWPGACLLKI